MSWLKGLAKGFKKASGQGASKNIPDGLWTKCKGCSEPLYSAELEKNNFVCGACDYHFPLSARQRLALFLDQGKYEEIGAECEPTDRLKFRDTKKYKDRLPAVQKKTQEKDALVSAKGKLCGQDIVACVFEFSFIGGSMGTVVGERFVRAAEVSLKNKIPLICFSASGGARMQEGMLSLMQMAKTSVMIAQLNDAGVPFISVLTNPTMGGVSASLAMLGDVNIAEPKALIGFAGPRVIEQTVREHLPEGFQRSEFLLEHGAIDEVVSRKNLREYLARLLAKFCHQPEPTTS